MNTPPNGPVSAKTGIDSLYCLKAVCAFFVVVIHSTMWGRDSTLFLLRIAVPCFYVISGYFLYSDNAIKEREKAFKWMKKIFFVYVFLCFVYAVFFHFLNGSTYSYYSLVFCFCTGAVPSIHLWYLNSMWQGLAIFLLLSYFKCWKVGVLPVFMLISAAFYTWGIPLFSNSQRFWSYCHPLWALALMGGGYFLAKYRVYLLRTWVLISAVSGGLLTAYMLPNIHPELLVTSFSRFCYFFVAVCIVSLCLRYPSTKMPFLSWMGKYHSANVYYYHIVVKVVISEAMLMLFNVNIDAFSPLLTFPFSVLLSVFLVCIVTRVRSIVASSARLDSGGGQG